MVSGQDPHLTPVVKAPPGQHSNLFDPPRRDWTFNACNIVVIAVSTPWILMRLYTRRWVKPDVGWDDITCLLGWVFMVALSAMLITVVHYGGGRDIWNVSQAEMKLFKRRFHDAQIVARVGMCFTKVSFLLFYQRLLIPKGLRWSLLWWAIWLCFWYNVLYAVALVIAISTECVGKGEKVARGQQCVNEYGVMVSASTINVSSDLIIFFIPLFAIWGLQMPAWRKWKLSLVFFFGFLAVASSVVRLSYQLKVVNYLNQSKEQMIIAMLNLAEQFIGVMVSCMPLLPAFYRHIRFRGEARGNNHGLSDDIMGFQKPRKSFADQSKSTCREDSFPMVSQGSMKDEVHEGCEELDLASQAESHKSGQQNQQGFEPSMSGRDRWP